MKDEQRKEYKAQLIGTFLIMMLEVSTKEEIINNLNPEKISKMIDILKK